MTDTVYTALKRVVKLNVPNGGELLVAGHSGFLFLDKSETQGCYAQENYMRGLKLA